MHFYRCRVHLTSVQARETRRVTKSSSVFIVLSLRCALYGGFRFNDRRPPRHSRRHLHRFLRLHLLLRPWLFGGSSGVFFDVTSDPDYYNHSTYDSSAAPAQLPSTLHLRRARLRQLPFHSCIGLLRNDRRSFSSTLSADC